LKDESNKDLTPCHLVYDVFGEVLAGDLTENPYAFTGKRFDLESELYHFHFRQYDAKVGVWTTSDPIGILGGINSYSYVQNNPTNKIDILGLHLGPEGPGEGPGEHGEIGGNTDQNDSDGGNTETHRDDITYLTIPANRSSSFWNDVMDNYRQTNEFFGFGRMGVTTIFGGAFARTYGGYSVGQYVFGGVAPHLGRHLGTMGLIARTTVLNAVLIQGAFQTGIAVGSIINVVADLLINRESDPCESQQ
jgi:RHS repeat-associated protein